MPIYEVRVKYPWHLVSYRVATSRASVANQTEAISEFNANLTSARESVQSPVFGQSVRTSDWLFQGILTLDIDCALNTETTQSPEQQLTNLAKILDAFLAGRFWIRGGSSTRVFGEVQERPRRPDEAIIVSVTVDEFLGNYDAQPSASNG